MEQHLFTLSAMDGADGADQGTTTTCPVSRLAVVDVSRIETERAVIAVATARDGRANERFAVSTREPLAAVCHSPLATQHLG